MTIEEQFELEKEMLQAGIERYHRNNNKLSAQGLESSTQHGRAVVASAVEAVSSGIEKLINTKTSNASIVYNKLQGMQPKQVAYLALVTVIDEMTKEVTLTKAARLVGVNVELQKRLAEWIGGEGEFAENVLKKAHEKRRRHDKQRGLVFKMKKDGYYSEWTNEQRIQVGTKLINEVITRTGLVKLVRKRLSPKKTCYHLVPTDETLKWIKGFKDFNEIRKPRFAPSIHPPRDWTGVTEGGYHSGILGKLPVVRVK